MATQALQEYTPGDPRGSVMAGHVPSVNSVKARHRKPVISTIPAAGVPAVDKSSTADVRPRPPD